MSRVAHTATAALVALVTLPATVSCRDRGPDQSPKADFVARPPVVEQAAPRPVDADAPRGSSADDVARQAAVYVRELGGATGPVVGHSPAPIATDSAVVPVPEAAPVVPPVTPLRSAEPQPAAVTTTTPLVSNTPTARPVASSPAQVAVVASAVEGMADEPMIVPEGTEFDGDAPPAARQGPGGSNDDALAERLATRVAEHPKDVLAHLDYQLHQFISGRPVPELAALAPLPAEDREVVAAVMDGLGNFRSTVEAEPNALLSKRVRPLVQTGERLSGHAGLGVPAVRLCRKVDGFGAYVPIEPAQFTAGGDGRMLVYAEVQNFASELDADGHWQTRLRHAMTLYEETGKRVASAPDQAVTDASRSRRRDFYTVARYQLPATLPPGRYILKVRIRDEQSDQVAEAPVPLEVLGR